MSIINKNEPPEFEIPPHLLKGNYKNFLYDFGLGNYGGFHKDGVNRLKSNFTKWSAFGYEGREHYRMKMDTFNYLWCHWFETEKGTKFFVVNELQQVRNDFKSYLNENQYVKFCLDICVFRPKDKRIFAIEIDNKEHTSTIGQCKARYRDAVLESRYGVKTYRIGLHEKVVPFKELDRFIWSE